MEVVEVEVRVEADLWQADSFFFRFIWCVCKSENAGPAPPPWQKSRRILIAHPTNSERVGQARTPTHPLTACHWNSTMNARYLIGTSPPQKKTWREKSRSRYLAEAPRAAC